MTNALSIRDLSKTYADGLRALDGISLDVGAGDFFALLGPNGAGKSTTIGIICSLVNKSAGEVRVFGHDIDQDFAAAKACIGLVPQEFNFNVFEAVEDILINQAGYYGVDRHTARQQAEIYLKQLGLWGKRRTSARMLSGGMKRRLMIARALVHEPRLLILDEPTAGVDIENRRSMWTFLKEINQRGITIILTTHYLEEAESLCRNIAIIDNGLLIENTSMKQLLAQLQTETFLLDLDCPLDELPDMPGYRVQLIDSHTIEAEVPRGTGLNRLFSALSSHNIDITSLRNKSNRLEQLFLDRVGDEKNRSTV